MNNLLKCKGKSNKGITLIALIITILVLLIITGVSIATLTGENGIINKATGAKAEMVIAEEKEAISLAYAAAIMETLGQDVTADDLKAELIVNGYNASKVTVTQEGDNTKVVFTESGNSYTVSPKGVITGPATGVIPPVEDPEEEPEDKPKPEDKPEEEVVATIPYYPQGFEKVEGTSLETGLVMTDGTNYWTWVEVPRTIYSTTYNTIEYYTYDGRSAANLEPNSLGLYTESECIEIEKALMAYTTTLVSRNGYKDEWYEGCGIATATEYNELKRKMLSSVYTNGGFWIGQYEMGSSTYVVESDNAARTPVCQKGAYPYNFVTCSQAQTLATNINSGDRTSSLLFGIQWDLVLKHLQNKGVSESLLIKDSSTWGNYYGSEFTIDNGKYAYMKDREVKIIGYKDYRETPAGSGDIVEYYTLPNGIKARGKELLLTTGASKTNSKMNIYDLAGNVSEITLECTYDKKSVSRGGYYWDYAVEPASFRGGVSITNPYGSYGFRPTLY